MTKIGFLGDLHGNTAAARFMLWAMHQQGITVVHQVGDFGVSSDQYGVKFADRVNQYAKELGIKIYVTLGNHENWRIANELLGEDRQTPAYYRSNILLLPRGIRWEDEGVSFVSLGGAPSVDRKWRREDDELYTKLNRGKVRKNQLWYHEEQITGADVDYVAAGGYADVMICHDAPNGIQTIEDRIGGNPHGFHIADILYATEGRLLLTEAFRAVAPKIFFHGHYHFEVNEKIRAHNDDGWCHVLGLDYEFNNPSMAILDTETLTAEHLNHGPLLAEYRKDNFRWPA